MPPLRQRDTRPSSSSRRTLGLRHTPKEDDENVSPGPENSHPSPTLPPPTPVSPGAQQMSPDETAATRGLDMSPSSSLSTRAVDDGPPFPDETSSKQKRARVTPRQLEYLEGIFAKTETPDSEHRRKIAANLQLTERQTQVWFQNRRAKERVRTGTAKKRGARPRVASGSSIHSEPALTPSIHLYPPPRQPTAPPSTRPQALFAAPPHVQTISNADVQARMKEPFPVTVIPSYHIRVGTWKRVVVPRNPWSLVTYMAPHRRRLVWYIQNDAGAGYRLEVPFSAITGATAHRLNAGVTVAVLSLSRPPSMFYESRGRSSGGGTGAGGGGGLAVQQRLGARAAVSRPIEAPGSEFGSWVACQDYTAGRQASQVLTHQLTGPEAHISQLVRTIQDAIAASCPPPQSQLVRLQRDGVEGGPPSLRRRVPPAQDYPLSVDCSVHAALSPADSPSVYGARPGSVLSSALQVAPPYHSSALFSDVPAASFPLLNDRYHCAPGLHPTESQCAVTVAAAAYQGGGTFEHTHSHSSRHPAQVQLHQTYPGEYYAPAGQPPYMVVAPSPTAPSLSSYPDVQSYAAPSQSGDTHILFTPLSTSSPSVLNGPSGVSTTGIASSPHYPSDPPSTSSSTQSSYMDGSDPAYNFPYSQRSHSATSTASTAATATTSDSDCVRPGQPPMAAALVQQPFPVHPHYYCQNSPDDDHHLHDSPSPPRQHFYLCAH